jgi:SAM-dependent methyltransferase
MSAIGSGQTPLPAGLRLFASRPRRVGPADLYEGREGHLVLTMLSKQTAVYLLRHFGLIEFVDAARFRWMVRGDRIARQLFAKRHGDTALPPSDLAYDAYGTLNWEFYWVVGLGMAERLAGLMREHTDGKKVLEWGCGPARIIRHLPRVLGHEWEIYGTDCNENTVRWCSDNIPGISFYQNDFGPPLPFEAAQFDCIYAISVFTHLSQKMQRTWMAELRRVLRPNGIVIFSTQPDAARALLGPLERSAYDSGELVVRGHVIEGKRLFGAYHPDRFVREQLLDRFTIVDHERAYAGSHFQQDLWIARKQ